MIYELLFVSDTTIIWQTFQTYCVEDSLQVEQGFRHIEGEKITIDRSSDEAKEIDAYHLLRSGWQPISVAMTTVSYRRPWQEKPMIDEAPTVVKELACVKCQLRTWHHLVDGYLNCQNCEAIYG